MNGMNSEKIGDLISPFRNTDLSIRTQQTPGVVLFENYEQLKCQIVEGVDYYSGFEYSIETYQVAVKHYNELKYVKNVLQKAKKEIVKSYNEPLEAVEARLDELIDLVKEPFKKVDEFIKRNEKNAKKYEIYIFAEKYARSKGALTYMEQVLRSPAFFDSKWLNASCSTLKWRAAVMEKIDNAILALGEIENMSFENKTTIRAYYYQTLSMDRVKELVDSLRCAVQGAQAACATQNTGAPYEADGADENGSQQAKGGETLVDGSMPSGDAETLSDSEILACVANSVNPYTGELITGMDETLKNKLLALATKIEDLEAALLWKNVHRKKRDSAKDLLKAGWKWTQEEDERLVEEFRQEVSTAEIARLHNRSWNSIRSRMRKLGLIE